MSGGAVPTRGNRCGCSLKIPISGLSPAINDHCRGAHPPARLVNMVTDGPLMLCGVTVCRCGGGGVAQGAAQSVSCPPTQGVRWLGVSAAPSPGSDGKVTGRVRAGGTVEGVSLGTDSRHRPTYSGHSWTRATSVRRQRVVAQRKQRGFGVDRPGPMPYLLRLVRGGRAWRQVAGVVPSGQGGAGLWSFRGSGEAWAEISSP